MTNVNDGSLMMIKWINNLFCRMSRIHDGWDRISLLTDQYRRQSLTIVGTFAPWNNHPCAQAPRDEESMVIWTKYIIEQPSNHEQGNHQQPLKKQPLYKQIERGTNQQPSKPSMHPQGTRKMGQPPTNSSSLEVLGKYWHPPTTKG